MARSKVTIFTDGGSHPNPGPGGWGALVVPADGAPQELSGSEAVSTNNRMELMAAIKALESLTEPSEVALVTDSTYLKKGITEWIHGWRRRGWVTASKQPVKNRELWMALDAAAKRHEVEWRWTRGHTGQAGNERAHELAAAAIDRPNAVSELPLGDRAAVHAFLGVAWSGKRRAGAWGAVLCFGEEQREIAGRADVATSNATHIASGALALEAITRSARIHIYTVSDYLRDGATEWIAGWRRRGWVTRDGKPVASRTWWERLERSSRRLDVEWHVVPKGDLPPEIERARELAREALGG